MTIGIFNVWRGAPVHVVLADLMIRSCKKVMPDVEIVQFTDHGSPAIVGVDRVERRVHPNTAMLRVEHYMACIGDWAFLDTDILVQQDLRPVFDDLFDIAIADRVGCRVEGEGDDFELYKEMPHNSGVVFSRSPAFWKAVLQHMDTVPPKRKEWLGDQVAVNAIIKGRWFDVKILPGRIYNCPPLSKSDKCKDAAIVHYKGVQRKEFMLKRFMEECA